MNKQEIQREIEAILNGDLSQRAENLWKWLKEPKQGTMLEILHLLSLYQDLTKLQDTELQPPSNFDVRYQQSEFFPLSKSPQPRR